MNDSLVASLGLSDVREISGGFQSRGVYAARLDGLRVVVKLVAARDVSLHEYEARVLCVSRLGAAEAMVCGPVALAGRFINELTLSGSEIVYAVAYPFAEGDRPDVADPADAALMGRTLAELHASLAALPRCDLPALAAFPPRSALASVAADLGVRLESLAVADGDLSPVQLLHGDFSWENVRVRDGAVRVFDFDDCGYGPVEFDLALSLYMVLFGAMTGPQLDSYATFRPCFLAGYGQSSGLEISEDTVDALITYRVLVLASWLTHPATAPVGVRESPDDWRDTLWRFIERYLATVV